MQDVKRFLPEKRWLAIFIFLLALNLGQALCIDTFASLTIRLRVGL